MNLFQKISVFIFGEKVKLETERWSIQCRKCSSQKNLWEVGGVRFKAKGDKLTMGKCSCCGRITALRVYKTI